MPRPDLLTQGARGHGSHLESGWVSVVGEAQGAHTPVAPLGAKTHRRPNPRGSVAPDYGVLDISVGGGWGGLDRLKAELRTSGVHIRGWGRHEGLRLLPLRAAIPTIRGHTPPEVEKEVISISPRQLRQWLGVHQPPQGAEGYAAHPPLRRGPHSAGAPCRPLWSSGTATGGQGAPGLAKDRGPLRAQPRD